MARRFASKTAWVELERQIRSVDTLLAEAERDAPDLARDPEFLTELREEREAEKTARMRGGKR